MRGVDVLDEMLSTFNNETELGKLYISYPMIEALREISIEKQDYKTLYLPLAECGNYKELVGGASDYGNFKKVSKEMWYIACNASRKRAALIVSYNDECSYDDFLKMVTQDKIYDSQKTLFIRENKMIGILSSIPLFLIEYYDEKFWDACKQ